MVPTRLPIRWAATTRLTTSVSLVVRSLSSRRVLIPTFTRAYATPAKPKKGSIGETAKRGRAAKPKAESDLKAESKPRVAASRKKTTTANPVKKTKGPSKTALNQAAAKKRAAERAAKSKAKSAESAAKKRERERARQARAKAKAKSTTSSQKIKDLEVQALSPPKIKTSSIWLTFWTAYQKNTSTRINGTASLADAVNKAKSEYASLSSSERESYERRGQESRAESEREYKRWVESHTPEEIRLANVARIALRRALKTKNTTKWSAIKDERDVKKPAPPFLRFCAERKLSGQHPGSMTEQAAESGKVWKALSDDEKKDYYTSYEAELAEYVKDYEQVYGHPPPVSPVRNAKKSTT
ncbi:High mobility group protein B3 [Sphaceloma murrayae]|uniref:High mobility group protein B3 n=1 Tax=Sphaceloma murrayae TaxID=2082308 RepID=A0A2K1QM15_9PEZI|nr:High mobility group protein B3 [Sphaceloma murrayae]